MQITSHEAVKIFTRYCRARFGKSASRDVRAKARLLEQRGDAEGHKVWSEVAEEIDKDSRPTIRSRTSH
jgi:hypothetical protein